MTGTRTQQGGPAHDGDTARDDTTRGGAGPRSGAGLMTLPNQLTLSRLALHRHEPRDLVAGAIAGTLAGAAFWPLAARWMP